MKRIFLTFAFCLLTFLVPCLAHALPTPDDVRVSEIAATDTITDFLDIGAGCANPVLVAHINSYTVDVAVSSVVADAGALTQLPGARVCNDVSGGGDYWCQDTWYRTGTGMTGTTQNTTGTLASAVTGMTMVLRAYCGVNQSTPFGTAVAEADNSVDVSSASGDLVIDNSWSYQITDPVSPQTGQTERYNYVAGFAIVAGGDQVGGGTITMSWTAATQNTTMGVAVKSPTAATATRKRAVVVQ